LTSLQAKTPGKAASTPQALVPSSSPSGSGQLTSRLKAIMELSAIYRQHVGMDPKGDPTQEPCSYRALFGVDTSATNLRLGRGGAGVRWWSVVWQKMSECSLVLEPANSRMLQMPELIQLVHTSELQKQQ